MHNIIMGFSNLQFYNNKLKSDDSVSSWQLKLIDGSPGMPLEFIDTAGCGFEEKINPESQSFFNPEEYFLSIIYHQFFSKLTICLRLLIKETSIFQLG